MTGSKFSIKVSIETKMLLVMARRMLLNRPGTQIILCSGYNSLVSEEKAKAIGIKGFAMKPLAKKDTGKLIRKVMDGEK